MPKESNQKRTFEFTDRALRGLPIPPKPQQLDYFDGNTRGLGLRISYGGIGRPAHDTEADKGQFGGTWRHVFLQSVARPECIIKRRGRETRPLPLFEQSRGWLETSGGGISQTHDWSRFFPTAVEKP